MSAKPYWMAAAGTALLASSAIIAYWAVERNGDQEHYDRDEMSLVIGSADPSRVRLFRAGANIDDASELRVDRRDEIWLAPGNYFLRFNGADGSDFYPAPASGYRSGPEENGALRVTVRQHPSHSPPRAPGGATDFVFVPSGHFLIGDRLNPRERHYVFVTGFFMAQFETTNAEFRVFLDDAHGWTSPDNWTGDGLRWKDTTRSRVSASSPSGGADDRRFGEPDQPVTTITWYEANAYCRWLTRKIGAGRWIYSLPTDAEWEKAARGPDNFDYGLGLTISDREEPLYNWKKNPGAPVTVVGWSATRSRYHPNRYGLYHVSGNVAEWTQSIFRPYGKQAPYQDDDRNHDEASGRRTVRGGSWYSATIAPLYVPYRDAFQPDHANNDVGFRVAARLP